MLKWFETKIARGWNRRVTEHGEPADSRALDLGAQVSDEVITHNRVVVPQGRRAESVAILGKTGVGKSSLIRYLASQDIHAGRGFLHFDLHGDTSEFLLKTIAARERVLKRDLSDRLIVIDPSSPEFSVGLNPLEDEGGDERFVRIAEFAQILKQRFHLESFGARTEELLRNSLYVLADNSLTLVELGPLLGHAGFRSRCLAKVSNPEVKQYFELRYDTVSDAMRGVLAEPILNKTSAFTSDPRFRRIIGQQRSTFSVVDALDRGCWIVLVLDKGRLGEQALTLGSLFLAKARHALFARKRRELFTLYCDEIQNLVAFGSGLEEILSEARKFGCGIVSANQFLDQYPAEMRAAILAVGTHIFFQLSSSDAQQIAAALDGGKPLAELLKNLQRRHMVVKTGNERWREAVVPTVHEPKADPKDLLARSRVRWARNRKDIEEEIRARQGMVVRGNTEVLNDWE
ncbi:MAG TPA: DUF87 domain-containing protein [Bryobacteraceae bacterium]|jgi:hypothetical protein|nr:DUF87 domain-containing protein [Bryobacteraceae bacterium]